MQMPWPHPWTCSRRATGHPPRSWQTPASRAISPPCTRTTRASRAARWTSTSSLNEKPKAVFSHTLKKAEWGPAEIFGGDLGAEIAELKARDHEGTVLVHGGPDFAKSLTRLGLVVRIPAHDGPDCDRRGAQPIRRAGRAPEARRRRRATLPERSSPQ